MPRILSDGILDAIEREASDADDLLFFDFAGDPTYLALAASDLRVDDKTWTGIGGAMVLGAAEEPLDLDGEGMEIQFVAIESLKNDFGVVTRNFVTTFLRQPIFGIRFEWRLVHWHRSGGPGVEGTVKGWSTIFAGIITGGFTLSDVYDEDGSRLPGLVSVSFRVMSPLAMLKGRRGIQTNPVSYKRWYPGDEFMSEVADTQVRKIYWGYEAPGGINVDAD